MYTIHLLLLKSLKIFAFSTFLFQLLFPFLVYIRQNDDRLDDRNYSRNIVIGYIRKGIIFGRVYTVDKLTPRALSSWENKWPPVKIAECNEFQVAVIRKMHRRILSPPFKEYIWHAWTYELLSSPTYFLIGDCFVFWGLQFSACCCYWNDVWIALTGLSNFYCDIGWLESAHLPPKMKFFEIRLPSISFPNLWNISPNI